MLHTDKYFLLPVYVDMGNQNTDTVTLAFAFSTTSTTRNWELKVSQIECWNAGRYAVLPARVRALSVFVCLSRNNNYVA